MVYLDMVIGGVFVVSLGCIKWYRRYQIRQEMHSKHGKN